MATFSNKNLTNVRGLFVGDKFIPTAIPNIKNWVSLFEELSRNPNKTEVLEFVRPCIDEGGNHVYYYVLLKVCKDDSCDGQGLVEKFFPLYVGCRVTRTDGRHHSFNKNRLLFTLPSPENNVTISSREMREDELKIIDTICKEVEKATNKRITLH